MGSYSRPLESIQNFHGNPPGFRAPVRPVSVHERRPPCGAPPWDASSGSPIGAVTPASREMGPGDRPPDGSRRQALRGLPSPDPMPTQVRRAPTLPRSGCSEIRAREQRRQSAPGHRTRLRALRRTDPSDRPAVPYPTGTVPGAGIRTDPGQGSLPGLPLPFPTLDPGPHPLSPSSRTPLQHPGKLGRRSAPSPILAWNQCEHGKGVWVVKRALEGPGHIGIGKGFPGARVRAKDPGTYLRIIVLDKKRAQRRNSGDTDSRLFLFFGCWSPDYVPESETSESSRVRA